MLLTKKRIGIIVLAVVLLVVLALLYYFVYDQERTVQYTTTGLKIPDAVHTYSGKVVEVTSNHIVLHALSENNYLAEDTEFVVDISADTKIARYSLPKRIAYEVKVVESKETPITVADIKKGDTVEVYTEANIKDMPKFPADVIRVIEL